MKGRVLVVDDEKNIGIVVQAMLERAGFEVLVFQESSHAMETIESEELDAVVTDLYMPGPGGMEILDFCKKTRPDLPVVMITAFGTVESAVGALKRGAFDFITKPFDQTELLNVVTKAVATHIERTKEPIALTRKIPEHETTESVGGMVGGRALQDVARVIAKIAPSDSTVLVTGESGTGKELVAQEIHRQSKRAGKPLIKVNCAVIPSTLIESELFGYERGAFTGAVSSKPGRFELAHEGTLFLDEIGEMPLEMQAKLLRVLQEREFERVGGVTTIRVDVRIVCATNRDLEAEVKAGRFREDLFYRLNVVPIHLPPLRERPEDIEPLARSFLAAFNERLGKKFTGVEPRVMTALKRYRWPGNIRQLENVIERMVLMGDEPILQVGDLPEEFDELLPAETETPGKESFKELVRRQTQNVERDLIEKALAETNGNVTRTAEKLGLSRKGLQLKMKELGIKRPANEPN